MWVWRALLRVSAQQHPQSGHTALDNTFFGRRIFYRITANAPETVFRR